MLYVDDLLIFSTNMVEIDETKRYLSSIFNMKNLNEINTHLEIKVTKHGKCHA